MTRLVRRVLTIAAAMFVVAVAAPALAQTDPPADPPPDVYPIVYPVAGPNHPYDNFGADRGDHLHQGDDIMADKGIPVVAAADGVVVEVRGINLDGTPVPGGGEWLIVDHGGWQTWYLHLNNDTYGTDDGLGVGIAPDIIDAYVTGGGDVAYSVKAGQLIGWVGDSGNAENSGSHLHFEIHVGDYKWNDNAIDPWPSLQAASLPPDHPKGLWNGYFADDDGSVHEADIDTLAAAGTTRGCNPPWDTEYCPQRLITRGEIAAFIRRTLDLPASKTDYFPDDDASVFNDDINAVMQAGIGFGCSDTEFCPSQPLLREEMAEMLVRSFAAVDPARYDDSEGSNYFTDDENSPYQESINRLMAAGVTKGCNPPDNDQFCPDRPLIRAEMASFFVRALGS